MGPEDLAEILAGLDFSSDDEDLLISLADSDDALVYRLNEGQALIKSLDFFTPVLDDPYLYGQAAAANSLSDIYAMGGRPMLALNICCFPGSLEKEVLQEILKGGVEKTKESGAILGGGHTVEDDEPKYGLSVVGTAPPEDIISNGGAEPGDKLILTKQLGTGIMATALKADMIEGAADREFVRSMLRLNEAVLELRDDFAVKAATDVTGFGLAGHLLEMLNASGVGCRVFGDKLSYFAEVPRFINMGLVPGGLHKNRDTFSSSVEITDNASAEMLLNDLIYDPQTSGGLLLALPAGQAESARDLLLDAGETARIIGRFTDSEPGIVVE
ncbi:selenophosphate synthase [Halarsenatibacter silvermanii]|uniref:Selenophosphate synthase n=1 Tax=Halarsenatibacter silvermanii TaxID=321763 RepID=A0A1G9TFS0_9FIRM|nr:selenide, water dikinase SelD [Halarsenatibacter silvermanii]SDM46639.1 selenophosphate synthase [Halarsenatibacter silvermanii]